MSLEPVPSGSISTTIGARAIQNFIKFYTDWKNIPDLFVWFGERFGKKTGGALFFKLQRYGFTNWFLGIDHRYQSAFLKEVCGSYLDLENPTPAGLWEIGRQYRVLRNLSVEELRGAVTAFSSFTEWDLFAQDLVWIRKFCIYTRGREITDRAYTGQRTGNLDNWVSYYCDNLKSSEKIKLIASVLGVAGD